MLFSSSYSVSEFFDAREYTTDVGDDSDLDSTEDEDIEEEEEEEEEDEEDVFVDEPKKRAETLSSKSSQDNSDVVQVY